MYCIYSESHDGCRHPRASTNPGHHFWAPTQEPCTLCGKAVSVSLHKIELSCCPKPQFCSTAGVIIVVCNNRLSSTWPVPQILKETVNPLSAPSMRLWQIHQLLHVNTRPLMHGDMPPVQGGIQILSACRQARAELKSWARKVHISAQAFLMCDGVLRPSCACQRLVYPGIIPWEEIHESMLCKSGNFFARGSRDWDKRC